jgi:protein-S-isoprenylcysteine O-methyltransferase Ste14
MLAVLIATFVFGVTHSLFAGQPIKQAVRRRLGDRAYRGLYRLGYNLVAMAGFSIVIVLAYLESSTIWLVDGAPGVLLLVVQGIGLAGLSISLLQIDLGRFLGLSQLRAFVNGQALPLPPESLQTGGVYRIVRHPLYLFSLLVIWAFPRMTEGWLAFNIMVTLYMIIGSILEERRLIQEFGQQYVDYQRQTSWLIPTKRSYRAIESTGRKAGIE